MTPSTIDVLLLAGIVGPICNHRKSIVILIVVETSSNHVSFTILAHSVHAPCNSCYLSLIQIVPSSILLVIGSVRGGTAEETGLITRRFKLILLINIVIHLLLLSSVVADIVGLLVALEIVRLIEHHHHRVARIALPMGCIQILVRLETTRWPLSHS